MKKLVLGLTLLTASALFAQSPFDGTWMTKLDTAKLPAKPDKYVLNDNMYDCLTCVPKVSAKADGTDQKVTGHPYYNTIAVKVVNASEVEIIEKKDGKVMYTDTETVSSDGKTLHDKFTDHSGTQPITGEATATRVADGPAGAHAISGSWRTEKFDSVSSNGLTITYQGTPNGLKMSDLNGNSYDAKFDGKEYPINGDPGKTTVTLKRISDREVEETDHRQGKVVGVFRMTVSTDGKSIDASYTDKERGTTTTFTMEKKS
jgi:hypothetical protein